MQRQLLFSCTACGCVLHMIQWKQKNRKNEREEIACNARCMQVVLYDYTCVCVQHALASISCVINILQVKLYSPVLEQITTFYILR